MTAKGMLGNIPLSEYQGPRNDFEQKLVGPDGKIWLDAFKRFLRKENPWDDLDLVRVDRTIPANYPDWVKEILYDELEKKFPGPAEFDIGKLEQWLHDGQRNGRVIGHIILQYLKDRDMLKNCLGLRDLEEIQKKGAAFFRKHFKGKCVFGWKTVVRVGDELYVPYLCEHNGEVRMDWSWLGDGWRFGDLALLFVN
jgi:hypothetical protein